MGLVHATVFGQIMAPTIVICPNSNFPLFGTALFGTALLTTAYLQ